MANETEMSDGAPRAAPFWDDFLPVAGEAFGVWVDRDAALAWAATAWLALVEEGLVPDEGHSTRDSAVALITLLALANVYRDYCQAAFDEPSYVADLVYAAEDSTVPDLAVARLAGERKVPEIDDYDSVFDMLPGLIAWRRPAVSSALIKRFGPDRMMRDLWLTCLGADVFTDADGEPLGQLECQSIRDEPWLIGGNGCAESAYTWLMTA